MVRHFHETFSSYPSDSMSEATPEEVTIEAAPPTNREAGTEATSGESGPRPTGCQTRDVVIEKIVTEEVML